jgi:AcrR family transcriptional regulator
MTSNAMRRIDARAQRTRRSLARALVALAPERGLDGVKVGELARRAGIGRSTFYAHYASKADFLTSSFVGMIEACDAASAAAGDGQVLPSRELFAHVAQAGGFAQAFARSRELPRMLAAAELKFRSIAEANLAGRGLPPQERRATAVFLAGGLVGMLRWWMDSGFRQDPEQLHAAFAELSRRTLESEQER